MEHLWLDHIRHKAQLFPREFGNPARKLCLSPHQYERFIQAARMRDCYISVCGYAPEFIKRYGEEIKPYEETAIVDTVYMDLDSERNLMLALADIHQLLKALPDPFRVYFTGSKGFAVYIDLPKLKLEHPKETLAEFSQKLAHKLSLKTADQHVFGDVARISRIPGTINTRSRERWGGELYCTPLTQEEIFGALNELDIAKAARKSPQDREIEVVPSDKIANQLYEIDGAMEEKTKVRELYREVLKIKGIKPREDALVEKLVEKASEISDGRKRILHFLIVPRLVRRELPEAEIEARCREFVERSGGRWRDYAPGVCASIRRTKRGGFLSWRLGTFIEKNPDLSGLMGVLGHV